MYDKLAISFFACFILLGHCCFGQSRKALAKNHIQQLKDGALFVRLKHYSPKENKLRELIANGSSERQSEYREQLEDLVRHRKEINRQMYTYFSDTEYFDFCPVYFFYNTDIQEFKKGTKSGYFLNAQLEKDPSIVFEGEVDYLVYLGPSLGESSYMSFIVIDRDIQPLEKPFPFNVNFKNELGMMQLKYLGKEKQVKMIKKLIPTGVKKMNEKLLEFYQKM